MCFRSMGFLFTQRSHATMFQHSVRPRHWLAVLGFAWAIGVGSPCLVEAEIMQTTMSWASVSGTYGGTPFTAQPLSIKFAYDSNSVTQWSTVPSYYFAYLPNGAGVEVTLGSILTNAVLDNLASNNSMLIAGGTDVFYTYSANGTDPNGDRATQNAYASEPATGLLKLTTVWSAASSTAGISAGFQTGQFPLTIGGLVLQMPGGQTTTGSIAVVPEPAFVPSAFCIGIAAAGFASWRRRRRSARGDRPGRTPPGE